MLTPPWWCSRDRHTLLDQSYLASEAFDSEDHHYHTPTQLLTSISSTPHHNVLPSGLSKLDAHLPRGFLSGHLIEFYGDTATGKTQWALTLSSKILVRSDLGDRQGKVLYIYTKSNFPIERIRTLLENFVQKKKKESNTFRSTVTQLMERLMIYHVTDQKDLWTFITHQLVPLVKNVDLMIVDSLSDLFIASFSALHHERLGQLQRRADAILCLGQVFSRLASQYNFFCLIINHISDTTLHQNLPDGQLTKRIPHLGFSWANCVNTRCYLRQSICARSSVQAHRTVTLMASSYAPITETCFCLDSTLGVTECRLCTPH